MDQNKLLLEQLEDAQERIAHLEFLAEKRLDRIHSLLLELAQIEDDPRRLEDSDE